MSAARISLAAGAAALVAVAALGLTRIVDPLEGDQSLFFLGAERIAQGGLLYRDFWDIKQPGIFEFYRAAQVFGMTPHAGHVLELLLWLLASCILVVALTPALRRPPLAAIAPLLTAGAYFVGASPFDLTQPEALAGAPIFISIWLFLCGARGSRFAPALALAAGIVAGGAVFCKLLFALVPLVAVCAAASALGRPTRALVARLALFAVGSLVPACLYLALAARHGTLALTLTTWFVVPREMLASAPHAPLARLVGSLVSYLGTYLGCVLLAAAAFSLPPTVRGRPWLRAMVGWILAALVVILVQRFSWWPYHFMLLIVPVGVLATFGCDALIARFAQSRGTARTVAALLTCAIVVLAAARPAARAVIRTDHVLARNNAAADASDAQRAAAFLNGRIVGRDNVYVAGNPSIEVASGTTSRVAINGWILELLGPAQWGELTSQLARARPEAIFVSADYAPLVRERAPVLARWLQSNYRAADRSPIGTWYLPSGRRVSGI